MKRCNWCDINDDLYTTYHDNEWGVPVHDDRLLFEMLILESFVAGLSWKCVLHKREKFKKSFDNFDVQKVAKYDEKKIAELLKNEKIIRHFGKIKSAIENAKSFIKIQKEFGSFDKYIWSWSGCKIIKGDCTQTRNELSDAISKDLKNRGMNFIGTTTIYAYLQSVGIINDHQKGCFLYKKSSNNYENSYHDFYI